MKRFHRQHLLVFENSLKLLDVPPEVTAANASGSGYTFKVF